MALLSENQGRHRLTFDTIASTAIDTSKSGVATGKFGDVSPNAGEYCLSWVAAANGALKVRHRPKRKTGVPVYCVLPDFVICELEAAAKSREGQPYQSSGI